MISSSSLQQLLLLTSENIEYCREQQTRIDAPSEFDVVCSQNRVYRYHRGNREYDAMLEAYLIHYIAANGNKQEVMRITKEIVSKMQFQFGSRFLNHDRNGAWEEASDAFARDEVRHALAFQARSMAQFLQ
jgi:hypothetical protein